MLWSRVLGAGVPIVVGSSVQYGVACTTGGPGRPAAASVLVSAVRQRGAALAATPPLPCTVGGRTMFRCSVVVCVQTTEGEYMILNVKQCTIFTYGKYMAKNMVNEWL